MNLSVLQKGLVLVAVPLVFQFAFVLVVVRAQAQHQEAARRAAHTKEVIALANESRTIVTDNFAGVRGSIITRNPSFAERYGDADLRARERFDALESLVKQNPDQREQVRTVRRAAEAVLAWQSGLVQLVRDGAADEAAARVRSGHGQELQDAFRREFALFLEEAERLERERFAALERARARLDVVFVAGGIAAVASTLLLAFAFRRGIARRFTTLEVNARRLAADESLPPPLDGTDEIAALDRAFRAMAAALRESAERVRDLYDNAPCGYHSVGPDGTLLAINRTELDWLGYDAADVIGRKQFAEMVSPSSRDDYLKGFAHVRAHGSIAGLELDLVRKDGSTFPVLVNSSSLRDAAGAYLRSRTTLTDIADRKRAEEMLRRLNDELESRVRERTAELEGANRDLAQKNAENEMFVYSVSHDLRSPLVNLQGFSKELDKARLGLAALLAEESVPADVQERARLLLDGKVNKAVGFIQAAVLRLAGIIDALLRLSRAGRVEYHWEAVDVAQAVGRVVAAAQGTVAERGATVAVNELPPAFGDRTAIEQVFGNLIGNALTYLNPARPGLIEVGSGPEAADGLRTYFVRDNGLGIAEGHRRKIFQPFQRAHPGVGSGEGLGLAIVARAVERHRGRIWVESTPGEGSTFFVSLPSLSPGR